MNYYYIDFENVKTAGLKGVDTLPSGDTVKIFAKGGSDQMKFNDIKTLMNARASVVIDDVVTGTKNALDFQLLADLTIDCMKRAGMSPAPKFVIISADRGYDPAITQMRKRGINNVFRAVSIKDAENGTFCGTQTAKQQTQKQSPKKNADAKPEEEDQNKPQQAKPQADRPRGQQRFQQMHQCGADPPPGNFLPQQPDKGAQDFGHIRKHQPVAFQPSRHLNEDPHEEDPQTEDDGFFRFFPDGFISLHSRSRPREPLRRTGSDPPRRSFRSVPLLPER